MGYLKGTNCYLSGAIDCDDTNSNWRPAVKQVLKSRFEIDVFDPFNDHKQMKHDDLIQAKNNKDWKTVQDIAWRFVRKDLKQVEKSDFLIANITCKTRVEHISGGIQAVTRQIPTTGTIHEIIESDNHHNPTLIVCEYGIEYIPSWLIGFIKLDYLFDSWNSLYFYLNAVNNGEKMDDQRWFYVYGQV